MPMLTYLAVLEYFCSYFILCVYKKQGLWSLDRSVQFFTKTYAVGTQHKENDG